MGRMNQELGHITRKTMLYQTKVEYGDWAMNHIQGCTHGCLYPCYAFMMARRFGRVKTYEDWLHPSIVDNTIDLLKKELPKHKDEIKQVQLCFTTDPFMMGYPEIGQMSVEAIKLINSYNIPCVVLTKGVLPESLAELPKINQYGITLVSLSEKFREDMEPGAARIEDRLEALKALGEAGCKTWISMEPYPTPNICKQGLDIILEKISFVDRIVFGRVHYDKRASEYADAKAFYNESARKVIEFCASHGIDYHIKNGTAG